MDAGQARTSNEVNCHRNLLEEVLALKRMELMQSPSVLSFLKEIQNNIAVNGPQGPEDIRKTLDEAIQREKANKMAPKQNGVHSLQQQQHTPQMTVDERRNNSNSNLDQCVVVNGNAAQRPMDVDLDSTTSSSHSLSVIGESNTVQRRPLDRALASSASVSVSANNENTIQRQSPLRSCDTTASLGLSGNGDNTAQRQLPDRAMDTTSVNLSNLRIINENSALRRTSSDETEIRTMRKQRYLLNLKRQQPRSVNPSALKVPRLGEEVVRSRHSAFENGPRSDDIEAIESTSLAGCEVIRSTDQGVTDFPPSAFQPGTSQVNSSQLSAIRASIANSAGATSNITRSTVPTGFADTTTTTTTLLQSSSTSLTPSLASMRLKELLSCPSEPSAASTSGANNNTKLDVARALKFTETSQFKPVKAQGKHFLSSMLNSNNSKGATYNQRSGSENRETPRSVHKHPLLLGELTSAENNDTRPLREKFNILANLLSQKDSDGTPGTSSSTNLTTQLRQQEQERSFSALDLQVASFFTGENMKKISDIVDSAPSSPTELELLTEGDMSVQGNESMTNLQHQGSGEQTQTGTFQDNLQAAIYRAQSAPTVQGCSRRQRNVLMTSPVEMFEHQPQSQSDFTVPFTCNSPNPSPVKLHLSNASPVNYPHSPNPSSVNYPHSPNPSSVNYPHSPNPSMVNYSQNCPQSNPDTSGKIQAFQLTLNPGQWIQGSWSASSASSVSSAFSASSTLVDISSSSMNSTLMASSSSNAAKFDNFAKPAPPTASMGIYTTNDQHGQGRRLVNFNNAATVAAATTTTTTAVTSLMTLSPGSEGHNVHMLSPGSHNVPAGGAHNVHMLSPGSHNIQVSPGSHNVTLPLHNNNVPAVVSPLSSSRHNNNSSPVLSGANVLQGFQGGGGAGRALQLSPVLLHHLSSNSPSSSSSSAMGNINHRLQGPANRESSPTMGNRQLLTNRQSQKKPAAGKTIITQKPHQAGFLATALKLPLSSSSKATVECSSSSSKQADSPVPYSRNFCPILPKSLPQQQQGFAQFRNHEGHLLPVNIQNGQQIISPAYTAPMGRGGNKTAAGIGGNKRAATATHSGLPQILQPSSSSPSSTWWQNTRSSTTPSLSQGGPGGSSSTNSTSSPGFSGSSISSPGSTVNWQWHVVEPGTNQDGKLRTVLMSEGEAEKRAGNF